MSRYLIRTADVPGYHPANHTGTTNRRLIGPETVGAKQVEMLLGVIEKGQGALPMHTLALNKSATCSRERQRRR